MPPSDKDSVSNLVSVFSALNKIKDEPKGVTPRSSVVKDENERVNPNLESTEVDRLKKIATIFGQTLQIGLFEPKPEAQKLKDLTPDKQKSLGISAIGDKIKPVKQEGGGLMGLLSGLLGLLGFGDIKSIMKKTLGWIGSKLWGILKWVGGKLWSGVKWLTGKLWSSVKWVGGKMWQGLKWLGTKLVTLGTKLLDRIKNSKIFRGFTDVISKIKNGIKNTMDEIINSIKGFIDDILKNITKVKDAAFNALKKIPGYKTVARASSAVSKVVGAAVQTTKEVASAAKGKAAVVGGKIATVAGNLIDKGKAKIGSYVGKLFKGSSGKIGSFFKGIPLLTPLIEGLFAANDIKNLKKSYDKDEITLDDLRLKAGERTITAITGVGGAVLGAAALSFIPGIGTLVGGVAGDFLGRYLGEKLVENLVSPNITKKLGSYITGTAQLQDFLVKDNKIFSFSNKDEVLGMKTGGAIDNLLKSQPDSAMVDSIVSHNRFNKTALIEQIKRQDTMIELLVQLVRKPSGGSVINHASNNNVSSSNFRDAYSSQTLVTN